jgi:hypothetical protein
MSDHLIPELKLVLGNLAQRGALTEQSKRRALQATRSLGAHLETAGIRNLSETTSDVVRSFVHLPRDGRAPAPSTLHFRRSIARLVFGAARSLGLTLLDPTLDLVLPPRSGTRTRALTDDEIALCREAAFGLGPTRHAAALALAEASARTSEAPLVRARHVDLSIGKVWIQGGSRTDPREGQLTPWGLEQVGRRIAEMAAHGADDPLLVSRGSTSAESRQASACIAIRDVLVGARLSTEPDVRPASVAAWTGARAFADGCSIEAVALLLGCRSLDQAARLIGWDWNTT